MNLFLSYALFMADLALHPFCVEMHSLPVDVLTQITKPECLFTRENLGPPKTELGARGS